MLFVDSTDRPDAKELTTNSISEFKSSKTNKRLAAELSNIESMTNLPNPEYVLRGTGSEMNPDKWREVSTTTNMKCILNHINSNLIVNIGQ